MLALYGHPFSSYTWKVLIALYANATPFAFRVLDDDHPEHAVEVDRRTPGGRFPLVEDNGRWLFESTAILEHLDLHRRGRYRLIPADPDAAVEARMIDRMFDNEVMAPMQAIVAAHLHDPASPDAAAIARAKERLARAYNWAERWLEEQRRGAEEIDLITCAAAPALFYADWVAPIPPSLARLRAFRSQLLALAPVARCVDEARPFRGWFPPGAPDRD